MITLPAAMVEAAARALYNLDRESGTDWWATAPVSAQGAQLLIAEAALTAAFGTCDIAEEWVTENRIPEDEEWEEHTMVGYHETRESAAAAIAMYRLRQQEDPENRPGTFHLMRRFVFTSNTAEEVDP